MAPSSSNSLHPTPTPPHQSPLFSPIEECEREEQEAGTQSINKDKGLTPKHLSTPLHGKDTGKPNARNCPESGGNGGGEASPKKSGKLLRLNSHTRNGDEALMEASRLKHSMAEIEKKLNKLQGLTWAEVLDKGTRHFSDKKLNEIVLCWGGTELGLSHCCIHGERARKLVPSMVRAMITPGFYVYGNVAKCKVICSCSNNMDIKGLISSP
ncbi:hypothetical protein HRI_003226800 [Hibiscus trionum]|uniref:Uncharacterized protein n=1 Tax=Hibiscus trionum TaxID=183268 RepID=A0A9W7IIT6_HIBTR|nr:hypothetical protein HRI_003226800 [Hibiscus trionum]